MMKLRTFAPSWQSWEPSRPRASDVPPGQDAGSFGCGDIFKDGRAAPRRDGRHLRLGVTSRQ
eukprot:6000388-Pyramimonas_sp.AAC.1